jgi:hypothetical protein
VAFSSYHGVDVIPPEVRALEIFLADAAEFSGSAGVALTAAAAVAHFCALDGFKSPFLAPRFGKIMRGIRLSYSKPVKPKRPFTPAHIVSFMRLARMGMLREWRAALPLALCFQQLLHGAECFDLDGSNVVRFDGFYKVTVDVLKNHSEGFSFCGPIDLGRPNCMGLFMKDFSAVMGITLGLAASFFACKLAQVQGILRAVPNKRVAIPTMRNACKVLIVASGLNPSEYATHSSKRGGALEAMRQGLSDAQITELG